MAAVVVVGLLGAAVGAAYSPWLSARHVVVRGAGPGGSAAVVSAAGLVGAPPMIDVNPAAASARIERLPWVDRAAVARRWPDTVVVRVTRRVPVAVMARPGGGLALVDAAGRVISWLGGAPGAPGVPGAPGSRGASAGALRGNAYPVLPKIDAPGKAGFPGSYVGKSAAPGLAVAAAIPPVMAGQVSLVEVGPNGSVRLVLTSGVEALMGSSTQIRAKFEALASVLRAAPPKGPALVDVATPNEPTVGPLTGS